jgi:hypothetical protein
MNFASPLWSPRRLLGAIADRSRVYDVARILHGFAAMAQTGATPPAAYQSLIRLYCRTGGWSNDLLHAAIRLWNRPKRLSPPVGVLGELSAVEIQTVAAAIRRDGYYVFPQRLPPDICDQLVRYASTAESHPSPAPVGGPRRCAFDPTHPLAPLYRFQEYDLVQNPDVQRLMADPTFLAIAQAYLGCGPVVDIVTMWWSVPFGDTPSADGAQLYHFDMDRVKWLKFFVYLTDVTPETGPHRFVAGSHRSGRTPKHLLRQGYARLPDAEVESSFPADAIITFTGPRGTIFAEDTRGLHKGIPPVAGERLVFELEYSDSLFGTTFRPTPWRAAVPELESVARHHPRLFRKYAPRAAGGS